MELLKPSFHSVELREDGKGSQSQKGLMKQRKQRIYYE